MSVYRRLLAYLAPHRASFLGAIVLAAVVAVLDTFSVLLLIPFLDAIFGAGAVSEPQEPNAVTLALDWTIGRLVDLDGDPLVVVGGVILLILAVVAVKNVAEFGRAYLSARVEQGVARDLRNRVYGHLLGVDLGFFGRTRTGQIVSRLTTDIDQIRSLVMGQIAKGMASVFQVVAVLAGMLLQSGRLTAAALVVAPLTLVVWGPFMRRLRGRNRRVLDVAGEVGSHVQETVSGIRLVKSATAERREQQRFGGLTAAHYAAFLRTVRLSALARPVTEIVAGLGTALILWYGSRIVVDGGMSGSTFISFLFLSTRLYGPVKQLSQLPAVLSPGLAAADRIFEFLDVPVEARGRVGARPFAGVGSGIRYRNVSLEYREGRPVLEGIDLRVAKGSVAALVGRSGAGKTSIVDLLGRFFDPSAGSVEIDGRDLRDYDLASLRRSLGIVSQETVLFHDTVRANMAYGTEGASDDEVRKAARAAHAHDFVMALPQGYDTVVGERGVSLSGGERQRVALARTILRDPPILVLDEATSSLDMESERLVQEAMGRLMAGRTAFVIAHRLATIRRADVIFVVDEGRVVQQGRHEELVERSGLYRHLQELQFR